MDKQLFVGVPACLVKCIRVAAGLRVDECRQVRSRRASSRSPRVTDGTWAVAAKPCLPLLKARFFSGNLIHVKTNVLTFALGKNAGTGFQQTAFG